ncbi:MAG TPA: universal stress protein [Pirellulaceae bacterium]|nr:universal stress protein [Pirellulaceae bacterium]
MIKSLLVGLDESDFSAAAVQLGIAWAKRYQALLTGVAIIYEPLFRDSTPPDKLSPSYKTAYDRLVNEARDHCQALLSKFEQQATAAQVSHKLLENEGVPLEQITLEAQRYDLILLGQETHFNFEGSTKSCNTLQKLLHNPPRPIVAVPKQPLPGKGVLVAYDGSVPAARTLHAFVGSGLAAGTPVYVLTIDANDAVQAAKTADRACQYLSFHDFQPHNIHVQSQESPSKIILDEALGRGVEMIVMGAYGHTGLADWLFGSTTRHILQQAPVPLFLYH